MNSARFDAELASALKDPAGAIFDADMRSLARAAAVRQYSACRPLVRRFGTGHLYSGVEAEGVSITLAGGPFRAGDTVTVDPGTPVAESFVLGAAEAFDQTGIGVLGSPFSFTVPALTYDHSAGAFVTLATPGLSLVAGQDTYPLPADFDQVEQSSFDVAIGSRATVQRQVSYYDAIYGVNARLSSVGVGGSLGYSGVGIFFGSNPNGIPGGSGAQSSGTTYRFMKSGVPQLLVMPAPTSGRTLDFFYQCCHIPETVPDSDAAELLNYALWALVLGGAAAFGALFSGTTEAGVRFTPEKNSEALIAVAREAKVSWDRFTRRPMVTAG